MATIAICPECHQGKHGNCDGAANVTSAGLLVMCRCRGGSHPNSNFGALD